jgi:hypothetical protein
VYTVGKYSLLHYFTFHDFVSECASSTRRCKSPISFWCWMSLPSDYLYGRFGTSLATASARAKCLWPPASPLRRLWRRRGAGFASGHSDHAARERPLCAAMPCYPLQRTLEGTQRPHTCVVHKDDALTAVGTLKAVTGVPTGRIAGV